MTDANNLIWIDLEMTGLDTDNDHIIEIATIVTDSELNVLAEGPVLAITQPDAALEAMDDWNKRQHGNSGLLERIRTQGVSLEAAEQQTLAFLKQYVPERSSPMCGNSICQDRRFLHREMPELERYFHYRHIDVSTLKELAKRWLPEALAGLNKMGAHLALDDIRESIAELRHYRSTLFIESARAKAN